MTRGPSCIEESVDVNVPVSIAYNQWTQFETFPCFMEGVEKVRQIDDRNLHWCAQIAGKTVQWRARITEQVPDRRVAWRSTSGAPNAGAVAFERLTDHSTRICLQVEYQPDGVVQSVAGALGIVRRRARADLQRFKEFIEARGSETGAWRGRIPSSDEPPPRV